MLIFAALNGKVFLVRKIRGPDRGHVYAMKVSICPAFVQHLSSICPVFVMYLYNICPLCYEGQYYSFVYVHSHFNFFPQVLKKANIVQKKKTTEHTRTERQVFKALS